MQNEDICYYSVNTRRFIKLMTSKMEICNYLSDLNNNRLEFRKSNKSGYSRLSKVAGRKAQIKTQNLKFE